VKFFKPSGNLNNKDWQGRQVKLKNQFLIDVSQDPQGPNGPNDIDPPYRLDPLQNIVNVNWGNLAVEFFPKAT
jgi:hypothetical protein